MSHILIIKLYHVEISKNSRNQRLSSLKITKKEVQVGENWINKIKIGTLLCMNLL